MVKEQNKTYPQPHCPNCGSPLRLIVERKEWFCDVCKTFPKTSAEISQSINKGTKEGRRKFWIYYLIAIIVVIAWFAYEGLSTNDSFLRNTYLIFIIILIITIPISIFLTKYSLSKR